MILKDPIPEVLGLKTVSFFTPIPLYIPPAGVAEVKVKSASPTQVVGKEDIVGFIGLLMVTFITEEVSKQPSSEIAKL